MLENGYFIITDIIKNIFVLKVCYFFLMFYVLIINFQTCMDGANALSTIPFFWELIRLEACSSAK